MEKILDLGRKIIPKKIFKGLQPYYHFALSLLGAIIYRFPAKEMYVIAVTGTKGKSTTTEIMNAILEENGEKTVLSNTIRTKVVGEERKNLSKMTTRGRFFTQRLLREALDKGARFAVLEISSEATLRFGHKFLFLDALIFTNLAPEHIESHGSYEKYVEAKLNIARELSEKDYKKNFYMRGNPLGRSIKNSFDNLEPVLVANADDKESEKFLSLNIKNKLPYSLRDATGMKTDENGSVFQIGKMVVRSKLPGVFNVSNMLGCITLAKFIGIKEEVIKKAIEEIDFIRGRMEKIRVGNPPAGGFDVVVDYAHTPDSLRAVYQTYSKNEEDKKHLICVLGNTGGGRDKWKRPEMGKIAGEYCDEIILTNEDPYDEDPRQIIEDMIVGIEDKKKVEIIMDRRTAIASALAKAREMEQKQKTAVLITGKGTDPYIMGPNGTKQKWDDATVAREELIKALRVEK